MVAALSLHLHSAVPQKIGIHDSRDAHGWTRTNCLVKPYGPPRGPPRTKTLAREALAGTPTAAPSCVRGALNPQDAVAGARSGHHARYRLSKSLPLQLKAQASLGLHITSNKRRLSSVPGGIASVRYCAGRGPGGNARSAFVVRVLGTGGIGLGQSSHPEVQGLEQHRHVDNSVTSLQEAAGVASAAGKAGEAAESSGFKDEEGLGFEGEPGFWSVVIPTYNRLPILRKCLTALEEQAGFKEAGIEGFEVVVVDDGSDDDTVGFLRQHASNFPHVRLLQQEHGGATMARNYGVAEARGATLVFIDSDMVVAPSFLAAHARALERAQARSKGGAGGPSSPEPYFTYGRVVNTSNFEAPHSEPFKLTDYSAAFFATGNVAIPRRLLLAASRLLPAGTRGPFDADFSEYGWEDLELGERLRQQGVRMEQCPEAVGYHWHAAFHPSNLPHLIEQERQRGRNGVRFFRKHPTLNVRLMVQLSPFHEALWALLTLGGSLNETTLRPAVDALVRAGRPGLAAALLSPVLNWHTVRAAQGEVRGMKELGLW